jgi:hypothetical protein
MPREDRFRPRIDPTEWQCPRELDYDFKVSGHVPGLAARRNKRTHGRKSSAVRLARTRRNERPVNRSFLIVAGPYMSGSDLAVLAVVVGTGTTATESLTWHALSNTGTTGRSAEEPAPQLATDADRRRYRQCVPDRSGIGRTQIRHNASWRTPHLPQELLIRGAGVRSELRDYLLDRFTRTQRRCLRAPHQTLIEAG